MATAFMAWARQHRDPPASAVRLSGSGMQASWSCSISNSPAAAIYSFTTTARRSIRSRPMDRWDRGYVQYQVRSSLDGPHRFELETLHNAPVRLFVWVTEKDRGVTYETLGINGAQASIVFRWDEALLASNIARRNPALIVLAYGTNEATNPDWTQDSYRQMFSALLQRLRQAAPDSFDSGAGSAGPRIPAERTLGDDGKAGSHRRRATRGGARQSLCVLGYAGKDGRKRRDARMGDRRPRPRRSRPLHRVRLQAGSDTRSSGISCTITRNTIRCGKSWPDQVPMDRQAQISE